MLLSLPARPGSSVTCPSGVCPGSIFPRAAVQSLGSCHLCGVVKRAVDVKIRCAGSKSCLCCHLAGQPFANHLPSRNFGFLICQMRITKKD